MHRQHLSNSNVRSLTSVVRVGDAANERVKPDTYCEVGCGVEIQSPTSTTSQPRVADTHVTKDMSRTITRQATDLSPTVIHC